MLKPVVLDARPPRGVILAGMLITLALGVIGIFSGLSGGVRGGNSVAAIVIGAVFLLIGLGTARLYRRMMRPHTLYFEPGGIRWDDPQAVSWAVSWDELAGAGTYFSKTGNTWRPGKRGPVEAHGVVFLHLIPANPAFAQHHPEMENMLGIDEDGGYCLALGPAPERIAVIEQGVRTFRPDLYTGVRK